MLRTFQRTLVSHTLVANLTVANMSFNAFRENKLVAKISGFRVLFSNDRILFSHDRILFSHDRILFSHDRILFSHDRILFSHDRIFFCNSTKHLGPFSPIKRKILNRRREFMFSQELANIVR